MPLSRGLGGNLWREAELCFCKARSQETQKGSREQKPRMNKKWWWQPGGGMEVGERLQWGGAGNRTAERRSQRRGPRTDGLWLAATHGLAPEPHWTLKGVPGPVCTKWSQEAAILVFLAVLGILTRNPQQVPPESSLVLKAATHTLVNLWPSGRRPFLANVSTSRQGPSSCLPLNPLFLTGVPVRGRP